MTHNAAPATLNPGKIHADLMGSLGMHRFRPERVDMKQLSGAVLCTFALDGANVGPLVVADVSQSGLGLLPQGTLISPGSDLREVKVEHDGRVVWSGSATAVYEVDTPSPRIGIRFTSSLFDLAKLQVKGSDVGRSIAAEIAQHQRFAEALPQEWIAAVSLLRQLLEGAKQVLDRAEQEMQEQSSEDTGVRRMNAEALIEEVQQAWGPHYYAELERLHTISAALPPEIKELGRAFATRELLAPLFPCPMHSRAYTKPRGYAGDYRLMTLYFKEAHEGASLYARFLHRVAQHYSLGHTVVAREAFLRETIEETVAITPSPRIVSLACGPAIEVERWAAETAHDKPVKFVLIDQDDEALKHLNRTLGKTLVNRKNGADIDLHCLQFSVKQLLKPTQESEHRLIREVLADCDLIYTAGLFDYLPKAVAQALTARLYSLLAKGGRLLIGNLKVTPDSTWLMEYVLSWHLEYRDEASMAELADHLEPKPRSVKVRRDNSEHCLFVEIIR
jgi:extracellular factor (EF) 3-hydroxypalmitic acid methyl ester biosynthesis protein